MPLDRRSFLQLLGGGALTAGMPESIARALAISAHHETGTIADVQHIVILMQENRSFDHYFGSLSGVRGFGDPRAVTLTTGNSVFHQPDDAGGYVLPFHPNASDLGLRFLKDLAHDWTTSHAAWNDGNYDQWVNAKTPLTMAHLQRADIPYHYALADAFTICDAYHCSLLGPTDPNRYHLFTGWVGNDGVGGGPAIDNAEAGYGWSTVPEMLEAAGVSWKVYQDIGLGLDAAGGWGNTKDPYIGNYGDNPLLYFDQYRNAKPGSPLYEKARTGTRMAHARSLRGGGLRGDGLRDGSLFDDFRQDVSKGTLPSVSWITAPEAFSEHPNWPPNYGAYFISQILDALTAHPNVWSKTAFFVMYDENDGFFDHVIPPTPPASRAQGLSTVSTAHEIYPGGADVPSGPYGLGARVPMLVISPWSKGGWVNSEVFDHTSLILFVQRRFGTAISPLLSPNITAWRTAVTGDLTSAFDFANPNGAVAPLPGTTGYAPPDAERHADYVPPAPAVQALPTQEPGTRPARAVPYVLNVSATANSSSRQVILEFINSGERTAVFHVRSRNIRHPPRSYTVGALGRLSDIWAFGSKERGGYHLSVYGPNGFYRVYGGGFSEAASINVQSSLSYDITRGGVTVSAANRGALPCILSIQDLYRSESLAVSLAAEATYERFFMLDKSAGWYDFLLQAGEDEGFVQQLAGHLETGKHSTTDPGIR